MTPADDHLAGTATSAEASPGDDVPSGNLFPTPKLTALDPADKTERASVERLLESLDESA